jgi:MFS family permease
VKSLVRRTRITAKVALLHGRVIPTGNPKFCPDKADAREDEMPLPLRFLRPCGSTEDAGKNAMSESPAPFQMEYQDRKTGLIVFGILTMLGGCIVALMVPLIVWAQFVSAKTTHMPVNSRAMIPVAIFYGLLAVSFIWLGIGSILTRRWARALLLILSWSWLAIGIVSMIYLAFLLPQIMAVLDSNVRPGHAEMPQGVKTTIMVVQGIFSLFLYVVLPGTWVLFYRSENVKRTCEVRDPVPRWTDRCPLPVLALAVWAAFGGAVMLLFPFISGGILPFFGVFLSGISAILVCLLIAVLWGYSARALYRLERSGWWIITVGICLLSVSAFLTYWRHDLSEVYRLMGYPDEQVTQLQMFSGIFSGRMLAWSTLIFTLPFVGYLLYVRRFFTLPSLSASR